MKLAKEFVAQRLENGDTYKQPLAQSLIYYLRVKLNVLLPKFGAPNSYSITTPN